jgi:DNA repair exonuclease SbcCD ATPase subunit
VISGPNGSGKSTLLRALRHALLDSHTASGQTIRQAMLPWGRTLSPRFRIVFSHDGSRWRLEKKFLAGAFCRLEKREEAGFRPLMEGSMAEDAVRAMLLADAPQRLLAGDSHLGLLQVLWTPQGAPSLPVWTSSVRRTIGEAFAAALQSAGTAALTGLIEERYLTFFTRSGKEKTNQDAPISAAARKAAQWRAEAARLRDAWSLYEQKSAALLEAREAVTDYREALRIQTAVERERATRMRYEELQRQEEAWESDLRERGRLAALIEDAIRRIPAIEARLASARARQAELEGRAAVRERTRERLAQVEQKGRDAKAWITAAPLAHRATQLVSEEKHLTGLLTGIRAPSAEGLAEISDLAARIQVRKAKLAASSLSVRLEAEAAMVVETGSKRASIPAGGTLTLTGSPGVELRVAGFGRVFAEPADPALHDLAKSIDELAAQLDRKLREWNSDSVEGLSAVVVRQSQLQQSLGAVNAELRGLMAHQQTIADLARRYPQWLTREPDLASIREDYRGARQEWQDRSTELERDAASENAAVTSLSAELSGVTAALEQNRNQAAHLEARFVRYAAQGSLADLQERRRAAMAEWEAARIQTLSGREPASSAELQRRYEEKLELSARLEGEIDALAGQNLYGRLTESEEALEAAQQELDAQRAEAAAIERLREEVRAAQQDLDAAVPARIAERATSYFRRIAGDAAPEIVIGQEWHPAGVAVPSGIAGMQELSGGELEQVTFATRLALGYELSLQQRQMLVLDDSFLATDLIRSGRILELLADVSERLQILILTCHPERYPDVPAVAWGPVPY